MGLKSLEPTVFIVDDDRAVREYVKWLIESVDLPTKTFGTAREFLDAYDMTPGCLVVDVRMPGLSGFDLQAELAARDIKLPIIMMTAYAEVPMAVRALKGGPSTSSRSPSTARYCWTECARRLKQSNESVRWRLNRRTWRCDWRV